MPEVVCACGKEFHADRANAKYCSDKCRKRTKRSGADVVALPDRVEAPSEAEFGPIESAARRELSEAGRLDTSIGWDAVGLARRLDSGRMETGSAYSSLSKEFKATMAEATRGAGKATAPQTLADELAARRARQGA